MTERWMTDSIPNDRFPVWTRGNAADVFPDPGTPLMWTFYLNPGLAAGVRDAYIDFGLFDWDELPEAEKSPVFGCFGGYLYNPVSILRLMGARMPGGSPEAFDKAYFDDHADVPPYVAEPWHESARHAQRLTSTITWALSTDSLPRLDHEKEIAERIRAERPVLEDLYDAALLARARSVVPHLQAAFETGMIVSMCVTVGPGILDGICESLGDPTMQIRLLGGVEVDSAKASYALWDLACTVRDSDALSAIFEAGVDGLLDRLKASESKDAQRFMVTFDEFIAVYGARGPKEWDLNARVWELHPEVALASVDRMRITDHAQAPTRRRDQAVAERDRVAAYVREALSGDAETLGTFESALHSSQLFMAGRERYKTTCVTLVHEIRLCFLELGRRMTKRGAIDHPEQVFMLLGSELDHFRHAPESFTEILRQRELEYRELYDLEPPFIVNGTVPPLSTWGKRRTETEDVAQPGTILRGSAGSGGSAVGRARVVLDAGEDFDFEPGDVLIAPETDPSWTPLFVSASAVVVNVGATGSHAMIVSRELGIPCVVSVAGATLRIPDGAQVKVDGNDGTVILL